MMKIVALACLFVCVASQTGGRPGSMGAMSQMAQMAQLAAMTGGGGAASGGSGTSPNSLMGMMSLFGGAGAGGQGGNMITNMLNNPMLLCTRTEGFKTNKFVPCSLCNMMSIKTYGLPNLMKCSPFGFGCCLKDFMSLMLAQRLN